MTDKKNEKHIISMLVENEFGVLSRVAGLFSAKGYNIDSLCVAETHDPTVSRMTIVTRGDEQIIEQILKQLNRMITVIKVQNFTGEDYLERELVLIKVNAREDTRAEILRIVDIFRAKVVDVSPETYTIEITGDENKISAFIELLRPLGIKELVRTGKVALSRGSKVLSPEVHKVRGRSGEAA